MEDFGAYRPEWIGTTMSDPHPSESNHLEHVVNAMHLRGKVQLPFDDALVQDWEERVKRYRGT